MTNQPVQVETDSIGLRIDKWFLKNYPALTKGKVEKLLRTGQIRINKGRIRSDYRLQKNDSIRIPPQVNQEIVPYHKIKPVLDDKLKQEWQGILRDSILYEDEDIIALNKPSGLAVQGGSGITVHLDMLLPLLVDEGAVRPRLVHRLDRDTSGVMLLAKHRLAAESLAGDFRERRISKLYWALCCGVPQVSEGVIDVGISKQSRGGVERMRIDNSGLAEAETLYRCLGGGGVGDISWLSCCPVSGRTHQIRVHLASLGVPILGDGKYGGRVCFPDVGLGIDRVYLHARGLSYGKKIIMAEVDKEFGEMMTLCGFDDGTKGKDKFLT